MPAMKSMKAMKAMKAKATSEGKATTATKAMKAKGKPKGTAKGLAGLLSWTKDAEKKSGQEAAEKKAADEDQHA